MGPGLSSASRPQQDWSQLRHKQHARDERVGREARPGGNELHISEPHQLPKLQQARGGCGHYRWDVAAATSRHLLRDLTVTLGPSLGEIKQHICWQLLFKWIYKSFMNQSAIHCFITCRWAVIPLQCRNTQTFELSACAGTPEAAKTLMLVSDWSPDCWRDLRGRLLFFLGCEQSDKKVLFLLCLSSVCCPPFPCENTTLILMSHAAHCNHQQYVITLNIQYTLDSTYCYITASSTFITCQITDTTFHLFGALKDALHPYLCSSTQWEKYFVTSMY